MATQVSMLNNQAPPSHGKLLFFAQACIPHMGHRILSKTFEIHTVSPSGFPCNIAVIIDLDSQPLSSMSVIKIIATSLAFQMRRFILLR